MNIKATIKALVILAILSSVSCSQISLKNYAISDLERDNIVEKVNIAINKAEKEILGSPSPKPDDGPSGPHPDPEKCICKGTGEIVQGDGHVTKCPFHPIELILQKMKEGNENE